MTVLAAVLLLGPDIPAEAAGQLLTFSETGITEYGAGAGYSITGTALTIMAPGAYEITGSCANGSIVVEKGVRDVRLELRDLSLASETTAPVVLGKASGVTIVTEGSVVLSDNVPADAPAAEGACIRLKAGAEAEFRGSGRLELRGTAKNGIKGGSGTSIAFRPEADAEIKVYADNNGITADGKLVFYSGKYIIHTGGDAIKASPDSDDTVSEGSVTVLGGTFQIRADGDGVQAETVAIHAGTFDLKTFDGYRSRGTKLQRKRYGRIGFYTRVFDSETMSCKGLKASGDRETKCALMIDGGSFTLDCADDAVHSDSDVQITGGTFTIDTGDDGIHADGTMTLGRDGAGSPEISIRNSLEGMDASTLYVYSGKYSVTAEDDGMNAAAGDGSITGDNEVRILGGDIFINSRGDGIDSNGDLNLLGGKLIVLSQMKGGMDSPLDAGRKLFISGAEVLAAGTPGVDGIASADCFGDEQNYVIATERYVSGTTIEAKRGGMTACSAVTKRSVNYVLYSAPAAGELSITAIPPAPKETPEAPEVPQSSDPVQNEEKEEPAQTGREDLQETEEASVQTAGPVKTDQKKKTTAEEKERLINSAATDKKQLQETSAPAEKEQTAAAASAVLLAKMTAVKKTKLKLTWVKAPHADGYEIWFAGCKSGDSKKGYRRIRTIMKTGKTSFTVSGLMKNHSYKAVIKAYRKIGGKKQYISESFSLHALTGNSNACYCNPKSVTLKKKKVTLRTGDTYKIKGAKIKKTMSDRKLIAHAKKFRFLTSDRAVAAVSKSGKIIAKGSGKCKIYVIANNGVSTALKVTVK